MNRPCWPPCSITAELAIRMFLTTVGGGASATSATGSFEPCGALCVAGTIIHSMSRWSASAKCRRLSRIWWPRSAQASRAPAPVPHLQQVGLSRLSGDPLDAAASGHFPVICALLAECKADRQSHHGPACSSTSDNASTQPMSRQVYSNNCGKCNRWLWSKRSICETPRLIGPLRAVCCADAARALPTPFPRGERPSPLEFCKTILHRCRTGPVLIGGIG